MDQNQFIFACSILTLGVMAGLWLLRRAKMRRARHWPIVAGHIESSAVTLTSGGGQPGSAAYYAELKYTYRVQGQLHRGSLRRRFMLKGAAENWIARYANCNSLTVRFDPAKVHDSVVLESDHPASAPRSVSSRLTQ